MAIQGCDVVLQSSSVTFPQRCSSCGMPPQTSRTIRKSIKRGSWTTTRSFQVPYCAPCAARASKATTMGALFAVATVGIAVVLSGLGFLIPGIPAALAVGLPIVLSLGFAIVAMTVLAPKDPPAPAAARGEAVKLLTFRDNSSTFHCHSPHWGAELAQMNGVAPLPKSRSTFFGGGALGLGIVLAPIFAGVAWFYGHPQVHIDNAGTTAVQVWIDGKKSVVVKADGNEAVFVGHGKHTFGASAEGAASPTETADGDVTVNDAHLYNPGETACYWLVADAYGSASVNGVQKGPQPIKAFYSFDKVDTWFGENPQSITVDSNSGQQGGTRVALQRAKACTYLAEHGCDAPSREKFVECEKGADSDAAFKKCEDEVSCGDVNKGEASGKSASSAHAGGHGAAPAGAATHSGTAPAHSGGHAAPGASGHTTPAKTK